LISLLLWPWVVVPVHDLEQVWVDGWETRRGVGCVWCCKEACDASVGVGLLLLSSNGNSALLLQYARGKY
jgi:hypothetical protein